MKSVSLTSSPRKLTGRTGVKKVRGQGRVPAVIYGKFSEPQTLEVPEREIQDIIKHSASENLLVDLQVAEDPRPKRLAMIKDVQHHPLTARVLHIDLLEVAEDQEVTITVPVESVGEPVGVKVGGGVLEHVLFSLKIRGLPKDLPPMIQVDVSKLDVGQSLHIEDLQPPPGVEIFGDKKIVVLAVAAGLKEAPAEEAEPGALGAGAQPEMIKEKKEESAGGGKKK